MITTGFGFESEEYISSMFYNTTDVMTKINVDEIDIINFKYKNNTL